MEAFPRRHQGPFFKVKTHKEKRGKGPTARRRAAKARATKRIEIENMRAARERDRHCRFPVCPCGHLKTLVALGSIAVKREVSHARHRGMGGNAAGDRSATALMVLLCNWRHKLSEFSIDRKGIRWVPLSAAGADGLIAWEINASRLPLDLQVRAAVSFQVGGETWIEVARETGRQAWAPFTDRQTLILEWLAEMTC